MDKLSQQFEPFTYCFDSSQKTKYPATHQELRSLTETSNYASKDIILFHDNYVAVVSISTEYRVFSYIDFCSRAKG